MFIPEQVLDMLQALFHSRPDALAYENRRDAPSPILIRMAKLREAALRRAALSLGAGAAAIAATWLEHSCQAIISLNIALDNYNIQGYDSRMEMINRPSYLSQLDTAVRRSPVTALLGPRQVGKTTLARMYSKDKPSSFFDLEYHPDRQRLQNPEYVLGALEGLVVIDEIQTMPELFNLLRVLVDRPQNSARFLILGSASPHVVRNVSESLAGRVEFVDLVGLNLFEVNREDHQRLWVRGGFPRSFLAESDADSFAWREGFVRTFLERDIPQLGLRIPAVTMRRFWSMLAHYHGQTWNASALARSMGLSHNTIRNYLDILTGTFMVRQLPPWFVNIKKRQVKSPKVYLRDSGILHHLLNVADFHILLGHPGVGASWEGFALEQVLSVLRPSEAYYWATYDGAELDVLFFQGGQSYGIEVKFSSAPKVTKSMRIALRDLELAHLWVLHTGTNTYPVDDKITFLALPDLASIAEGVSELLMPC